ncbi:hypothetical protein PVK06_010677 [Gossypium arboreum]|uniref:Uncharacterized protein n=1 Tax=Gossypium arboreum TaxID=29729 RepID=A0ABR0Q784_GOSAR|nr:hypothetical protein PVK06_010677 [Gossypium arboreum]
MAFPKNSSSSRSSLGFSGKINMEGDATILVLFQLVDVLSLFLSKLLFDYIKRRNRATVAPNHRAATSAPTVPEDHFPSFVVNVSPNYHATSATVAPNHINAISMETDATLPLDSNG